jgi:hypothetical protein
VARVPLPARRPGLRRRGLPPHPGANPRAARHRHASRAGGHRLRGVHLALRGVLERSADPLAALDDLHLDGLGRPGTSPLPGTRRCAAVPGGTGGPAPV